MILTLLQSLVFPAFTTGLVLTIAHRFEGRDQNRIGWAGLPLALGTGYLTAQIGIFGLPPWPPVDSGQWLAFAVAGATIWGWLSSGPTFPGWFRWTAAAGLSAGLGTILLLPLIRYAWTIPQSVGLVAAAALGVFGLWSLWHQQTQRLVGSGWLFVLAGLSGLTALSLLLSGSASMGLLAGGFAFSLGAAWLFSLIVPAFRPHPGAAGVLSFALVGMWIMGLAYTDMPWFIVALLAGIPLGWSIAPRLYHSKAARAITRLTTPGRPPSGRLKAGPGKNQPA